MSADRTVFVGNLSWDTRWQGLKDHMRQAGNVMHAEVFTEASGRSAGCGIVEYETRDEAMHAIQTMNDSVLDGRQVFVREDRDQGRRPGGGGGGGFGGEGFGAPRGGGGGFYDRGFDKGNGFGGDRGGGFQDRDQGGYGGGGGYEGGRGGDFGGDFGGRGFRSDRGRKVVVTNLPYHTRWQELKDIFRSCGEVIRADVMTGPDGRSRGMGTILFETEDDANQAISRLNGAELDGRIIEVRLDRF